MRRKTNLFYTTGTDADFLTFSNYTDGMTGNFLATDIKMFPSKFLCLYMPSLSDREEFIKALAGYYENKLAFMRDAAGPENGIMPLGWLMDFLYDYDNEMTVEYVGQVTEQDYNGIYADTICIIDASDCSYGEVVRDEEFDTTSYEDYNSSLTYLYGWYDTNSSTGTEQYTGPSQYKTVHPQVDEDGKYYYMPKTSYIEVIHPTEPQDIRFNIIIPLYDIISINPSTNTDTIQSMDKIDCRADDATVINVPYGIWFAKDEVLLKRDGTSWSPSWSLAIGSQFKPFPYSETPINEVSQAERASAFMTFAQALVRQNALLSKLSDITMQMSYMSKRISAVESNLKSIGTSYNIDGLHLEMSYLTSYMSDSLSYMQQEIEDLYI